MNRRNFLKTTGVATVAASILPAPRLVGQAAGVTWPIGCFNRPWVKWSYDEALQGIKSAGYKLTGLLTRTKDEPFIGSDAEPAYLAVLRKRIAGAQLVANMGALRVKSDQGVEDQIKDVRKQIDHARILGLEFLLTFGVDRPGQYENYYKAMADAAAYADEKKLKLVLKPHGGGSGASEEILRCMEKVKHPNFRVWYDPGNIIYYTGKDPVAELEHIAQHVTGICAKDCDKQKGDVMIQFGDGKVDFKGVFQKLKAAGFNGPVMVECCKIGETAQQTTTHARANREFLERVFATI
jgi:sugar phosphate isomerase/epimerase